MQENNINNIISNILKPDRFFIILKKVYKKFFDLKGKHSEQENVKWIKNNCSSFENLAKDIDPLLWEKATEISSKIEKNAKKKLFEIKYNLGGGGMYPMLYFITRHIEAKNILETGVAAGFSSSSFLYAIKDNNFGKLYSSDFPYFRLPEPEKYIGIVVDDSLKDNWELFIDGDSVNIPKILKKVDTIDLVHYDSDKTYSGRQMFMSLIEKKLTKDTIIIMDDIEDNSFFYDYIQKNNYTSWYVFEFKGKYIGMIGNLYKKYEK